MEAETEDTHVNNPLVYVLNDDEKEKKEEVLLGAVFDPKILRMMDKMGYQSGKGLGKENQGITEPVKAEVQSHRRGLGLKIENLQWNFAGDDEVSAVEKVEWLHCTGTELCADLMLTWPVEDKPVTDVKEEHHFCDKDVLNDVVAAKNIFDHFDLKELLKARARANPFETIYNMFFMNRAALKMANIDAATEFMFTKIDENPFYEGNQGPYYFADVCAGPGGFTEYVLWRKKWQFKGFGFTLRGDNDFKLTESVCASPVTFLPLYGSRGDGDVCCPENIDDFKEKVLFETENEGVHFMMSDGGFSVEGNENFQEILSKNIYICQCLVALEILRVHGHFVTKVFDLFTCFSVGLLFLIYHCFEKVCILKPNSSRPANSERYIICANYKGREHCRDIRFYLRKLVDRLWELKDNIDLDLIEIVPVSVLKNDHNFFSYIFNSNNKIAIRQTRSLHKMASFCNDPILVEHNQHKFRQSCLKHWQIPDSQKRALPKCTVESFLSEIVHNVEMLFVPPQEITSSEEFENTVNLKHWDYALMHYQRNKSSCHLYAGVGSTKVFKLHHDQWVRVKNLQLIRGTLLYGELVKEKIRPQNSDRLQHKYSLHVIDALRLGEMDLSSKNFENRRSLISLYCKAVNHEFKTSTMRIRPKIFHRLESLGSDSCVTEDKVSQNIISRLPVLGYKIDEEFYDVSSVLLLETAPDDTFCSTYLNRKICFLNRSEGPHENHFHLQTLISAVRGMKQ